VLYRLDCPRSASPSGFKHSSANWAARSFAVGLRPAAVRLGLRLLAGAASGFRSGIMAGCGVTISTRGARRW
jgi:hypothetical protein